MKTEEIISVMNNSEVFNKLSEWDQKFIKNMKKWKIKFSPKQEIKIWEIYMNYNENLKGNHDAMPKM